MTLSPAEFVGQLAHCTRAQMRERIHAVKAEADTPANRQLKHFATLALDYTNGVESPPGAEIYHGSFAYFKALWGNAGKAAPLN